MKTYQLGNKTSPKRWFNALAHLHLAVRSCLALAVFALLLVASHAEETVGPSESPISADDREHWSYQPLIRPPIPAVENDTTSRNPIDCFVLARLKEQDIQPQPSADRFALIRRLTIDLTGLPPTRQEVDAFVGDDLPDAYERLVDRLLASPAFGERYAQYWLDLARWAETDGFEHDKERPRVWKYRDWVIDALNRDLPYDEFVSLQLAGDELRPGDAAARTATGFCLAGPDMPDINLKQERKANLLNELTGTAGSVFLAMQMGCAQCHEHKYDPISQHDFYRLRAIFEPAVDLSGHTFSESVKRPKPNHLYVRGDFRRPGPQLQPAFPRVLNRSEAQIQPPPDDAKSTQRRLQLARWLTQPDHPLTARVIANRLWQWHFGRGLSSTPSDFGVMGYEPTHPQLLDWLASELVRSGWSMKHIHRLIVTSATYRRASGPASPDDPHWAAAKKDDPANRLLWRYPRRRLEGEALRDMMLAASESLNTAMGGESVRPPLPEEVVQTLLRRDHWKVSPSERDHYRRSVYIFARRNLRFPMFEAFDRPAATASCAMREQSTTAPQSLLLLNSQLSLEAARRLAGRVLAAVPPDNAARVRLAYRLTLTREPSDEEMRELLDFINDQEKMIAAQQPSAKDLALPVPAPADTPAARAAAWVDVCLALFNCSEFVYLE